MRQTRSRTKESNKEIVTSRSLVHEPISREFEEIQVNKNYI